MVIISLIRMKNVATLMRRTSNYLDNDSDGDGQSVFEEGMGGLDPWHANYLDKDADNDEFQAMEGDEIWMATASQT